MNREHLQALVWLRWRLTRNSLSRAGPLSAVISLIMLGFLLLGGLAVGVVGLVLGGLALADAKPQVLLWVWDGLLAFFLFIWLIGLVVEIQRSETIDLSKLLHLPITLRQVFVLNYLASHVTPSVVLFLPAVVGVSVGLALRGGVRMVLVLPLALSFFFLLTAWTYCLRGWLTALMVNKRRRRAIIVWITLVLVLAGQIPNLVVNSSYFRHRTGHRPVAPAQTARSPQEPQRGNPRRTDRPTAAAPSEESGLPPAIVLAHLALPPGWVGYGAMALKEHQPWPALGGIVVASLLGALGLLRAFRMTLRFYQGAADGTPANAKQTAAVGRPKGLLLVERRLPWLPEDTAGLTLATFQSLRRSPELKMALIMPVVLAVVFGSLRLGHTGQAPPAFLVPIAGAGAALLSAFSVANIMSNVFGLDRNGFRALVLLPTRRHHILLAKNLAFFPLVAVIGLLLLLLARVLLSVPWSGLLAGLVQIPLAFVLFCLPCNLVSILVPYRLALGTLQAKKVKPIVFLGVLITMASLPLILVPMLIAPGLQVLFTFMEWVPWLPVNFLASLGMLAAVAWVYWLLLPFEGRLLQKRELAILRDVTEEVE